MIVQFAKWGNSVALRIPAPALQDAGVKEGSHANLSIEDGKLILTPISIPRKYSLDELLAGLTQENMSNEFFDDPPVGTEIW